MTHYHGHWPPLSQALISAVVTRVKGDSDLHAGLGTAAGGGGAAEPAGAAIAGGGGGAAGGGVERKRTLPRAPVWTRRAKVAPYMRYDDGGCHSCQLYISFEKQHTTRAGKHRIFPGSCPHVVINLKLNCGVSKSS